MARPRNLASDTPGLPGAVPEGFHYRNRKYSYGKLSTKYPSPGASHPPKRLNRPLQQQDRTTLGRADSKRVGIQVKLAPHGTNYKNLLERRPPQLQEHSSRPHLTSMN
jgi:hypothetical protein